MTKNTSVAYLKSIKSSPLKICRVSRSIRGQNITNAIKLLTFSKLKVSSAILQLVKSAAANAENNHNMDIDRLIIKEVNIGKSMVMKRFHTRGRGRSSRILKTYSNIRVVLSEVEDNIDKKNTNDNKIKEKKNGSKS
jgi:large subunit ribosomal protein L22